MTEPRHVTHRAELLARAPELPGLLDLAGQHTAADVVRALVAEVERRIDPDRLEALTIHPPISITPMRGVSMAGDRWIVSGGCGGRGVDYARTFPEALKIAEAHRRASRPPSFP